MADSYRDRDPRERDIRFFFQLSEEERMGIQRSIAYRSPNEWRGRDSDDSRHTAIWLGFMFFSFSLLTFVLASVSRAFLPIRHFALAVAIPLFLTAISLRAYDSLLERRRAKHYYYDE